MSEDEIRSRPTRFQDRTIDYVIRRFWDDPQPAQRFLVADEVGLGKTVVAREVLAEALRRRPGESVDIVYLCSSQPVASQNLKRLRVRGHGGTRKATRLTMLALEPAMPSGVRYFALTPDTSFKVSGRSGTVRERALIHACLRKMLRGDRFDAVMRQVSEESWERETARMAAITLDRRVVDAFQQAVRSDAALVDDIRRIGREILDAAEDERLERGLKRQRDDVVGRLRRHLAIHSAQAMASNGLVIVDEFQRFAPLLDTRRIESDIAVRLVDRLLSRDVPDRRVLLLSATPYRIPGAETVPGQTPYANFVALVRFLADEAIAADLAEALDRYTQALRCNPPDAEAIMSARSDARAILRPIMCRTERTGATSNPNAMVREETRQLDPEAGDLAGAISARRIARRLKVRDPVEYWKSAPFLLDFMRDYQLRTSVTEATLGRRPRNLAQVIAKTAVGGPGACAYRALQRTASGPLTEAQLRRSAFHVARGFQSLFNQSEAAAAVQLEQPGRKRVFWDQVLDYSLAGNLQAVLDEHLHFEADGLAMFDGTDAKKLEMAAKAVHGALTLRRASIDVRGLGGRRVATPEARDTVRLRCRHGARFAEVKEADGEVKIRLAVRCTPSGAGAAIWSSCCGGMARVWCSMPSAWNVADSPGRRPRTVSRC